MSSKNSIAEGFSRIDRVVFWVIFVVGVFGVVLLYFSLLYSVSLTTPNIGPQELLAAAQYLIIFCLLLFQTDSAQPVRSFLFAQDPIPMKLHLAGRSITVGTLLWASAMPLLGFTLIVTELAVTVAVLAIFSMLASVFVYAQADNSPSNPTWRVGATAMLFLLTSAAATGITGLFNTQSLYISISMLTCGTLGGFQLIRIRQVSAAGAEISGEQFADATLWMRLYIGAWLVPAIFPTLQRYAREADHSFSDLLEKSLESIVLLLLGGVLVHAIGPGYAKYRAILDKTPSHGSHKQRQSRLSGSRIRLGRTRRRAGSNRW